MSELTQPSPFIRSPRFDGCEYSVRFGNRYPFPCIVIVEEDTTATRNRFTDLRLYPLDEAGRDAAAADLQAIEAEKRLRRRDELRDRMRRDIESRQCRYCVHFPRHKTPTAVGDFFICARREADGVPHWWDIEPTGTCPAWKLNNKYNELSEKGN